MPKSLLLKLFATPKHAICFVMLYPYSVQFCTLVVPQYVLQGLFVPQSVFLG